jgi:hypothetical protein
MRRLASTAGGPNKCFQSCQTQLKHELNPRFHMKECPICGIARKKLSKKCFKCALDTCGNSYCGVTIKGKLDEKVTLLRSLWVCQECIEKEAAKAGELLSE